MTDKLESPRTRFSAAKFDADTERSVLRQQREEWLKRRPIRTRMLVAIGEWLTANHRQRRS